MKHIATFFALCATAFSKENPNVIFIVSADQTPSNPGRCAVTERRG